MKYLLDIIDRFPRMRFLFYFIIEYPQYSIFLPVSLYSYIKSFNILTFSRIIKRSQDVSSQLREFSKSAILTAISSVEIFGIILTPNRFASKIDLFARA